MCLKPLTDDLVLVKDCLAPVRRPRGGPQAQGGKSSVAGLLECGSRNRHRPLSFSYIQHQTQKETVKNIKKKKGKIFFFFPVWVVLSSIRFFPLWSYSRHWAWDGVVHHAQVECHPFYRFFYIYIDLFILLYWEIHYQPKSIYRASTDPSSCRLHFIYIASI